MTLSRTDAGTRRAPALPRMVFPVVLGTLLNALNSSMIAVALVSIAAQFHMGTSVVWLVSGLYLANTVAQPTMGRLADQFGPRRIFCAGLIVIVIAALGATFAPSFGWLLLARVLLGIGTSAAYPAGMALIKNSAAQDNSAAGAAGPLGAISAASQVAVALGPPLGGVLVLYAGWRSVFWVNLPVAAIALVLTLLWVRKDDPVRSPVGRSLRELDPLGIVLFAGLMIFLLLFLFSIEHSPTWIDLIAAAIVAVVLMLWERRSATPFLDVRMLVANRPLTLTYVRCAVTYIVFYSVFYGLPQWLEQGRGMSSAAAGLMMLPVACFGVLATVLATRMSRHGYRRLLIIGSAGLLIGSLALVGVGAATPIVLLLVVTAVLGLPNGFNNMGNQTAMYESAEEGRLGVASGLYRTAQYIGANLASAAVGLSMGAHATDGGLHALAVTISVISAGLLITAVTSRKKTQK